MLVFWKSFDDAIVKGNFLQGGFYDTYYQTWCEDT